MPYIPHLIKIGSYFEVAEYVQTTDTILQATLEGRGSDEFKAVINFLSHYITFSLLCTAIYKKVKSTIEPAPM